MISDSRATRVGAATFQAAASLAAALLVSLHASAAWGQQEEGLAVSAGTEETSSEGEGAARPVKLTGFVFTREQIDDGVATEVIAGLRRGVRRDERLEWVDPSEVLEAEGEPEDSTAVDEAVARAEQAFADAAAGQWAAVTTALDEVLEVFEANLSRVRRATLVDASLLWAAAQCMEQRERACQSGFRQTVIFREDIEWDPRLPADVAGIFESVREETLAGPRGSIRIETYPLGAEVFVDGRFIGAAPARAEGLLAGDHFVTVEMLGYRRQVVRATVQSEFEDTLSVELEQLPNAPLLRDALRAARQELGAPQVGAGMRDLWSLLLVDQVILGDLQRRGESDSFDVRLYLYDLRTGHGLREIERRLDWQTGDLGPAEALVADLYREVDLTGRIRPAPVEARVAPVVRPPFHRTWWFWSIVGAVVVGTTIGVASALLPERLPEGVGEVRVGF